MRDKLKLHDARPLDVLIWAFICANWGVFQNDGVLNPGQNKVPELARFAVEGAGVPAQAGVQYGERYDFTLAFAIFDRLVLDTHRALMTDGPCDTGQNTEVRLPKFVGNIASDASAGSDRFSVTKAFGQPGQDPLSRKVKHWLEGSPNDVCLGAAVVFDIFWGHLFI